MLLGGSRSHANRLNNGQTSFLNIETIAYLYPSIADWLGLVAAIFWLLPFVIIIDSFCNSRVNIVKIQHNLTKKERTKFFLLLAQSTYCSMELESITSWLVHCKTKHKPLFEKKNINHYFPCQLVMFFFCFLPAALVHANANDAPVDGCKYIDTRFLSVTTIIFLV